MGKRCAVSTTSQAASCQVHTWPHDQPKPLLGFKRDGIGKKCAVRQTNHSNITFTTATICRGNPVFGLMRAAWRIGTKCGYACAPGIEVLAGCLAEGIMGVIFSDLHVYNCVVIMR